jgi:predicted ArsR family transcriptional regulator
MEVSAVTDDSFEALWFLYTVSRRSLAGIAGRSSTRTSTLTYFHRAIRSTLGRSNNVDTFLKALEKTIDLNFRQEYEGELPSRAAFETLFRTLKKQGMLPFMPQLTEREAERRREFAAEDEAEEEVNV